MQYCRLIRHQSLLQRRYFGYRLLSHNRQTVHSVHINRTAAAGASRKERTGLR